MKFLANEGIDIIYYDSLLSYDYLSALAYRLQEYFARGLRALRKRSLEYRYLFHKVGLSVKRTRRPETLNP